MNSYSEQQKSVSGFFAREYDNLVSFVRKNWSAANEAEAEDIVTGIRTVTGTAFVTFVALDKNGKPTLVPKLSLKTDDDRIKFEEGKIRMDTRLKNRQK